MSEIQSTRLQRIKQELLESKEPLMELLQYVKPYKVRYIFGILCNLGFNMINSAIPLLILFVGNVVFGGKEELDIAAMIQKASVLDKPWIHHLTVDILHLDHISRFGGVIAVCIVIPAVMMVRSVLDYLNNYISIWVGNKVLIDIRAKLVSELTRQSLNFFNETKAGTLIQSVFNETLAMQGIFFMISQQISQPIGLLSGIAVLLKLNGFFTIGALVLFPACIVPVMSLGKKIRRAAHGEQLQRGDMMVILHELIAGIKVIKSFARTSYEVDRFNKSSKSQFQMIMRVQRSIETIAPVVEFLAAIGVSIGIFYAYKVNMTGTTLMALCAGIFLLYSPTKGMSKTHLNLIRSLACARNVFELMKMTPAVDDAPDAVVLRECQGTITFKDVDFGYREGILAVENINITFERGKYYALVGLSGSGKSTMLSLILRFYDPLAGLIFIDGHDLHKVTQNSLREQIGIVTQETFLFHDTIFKNIAYGRLDATREEVIAAAKQAYAHDFIMAQQDGYDTIVGDRGCQLSGGQQQRLAIARALLKNAPVLLLDEAMSALDSESEKQVQSAVDVLIKGRTVIAIAHRLSTILKADQIVVLDKGCVVETGTHRELLAKGGHYRRLYDLQFEKHDESRGNETAEAPKNELTKELLK